MHLIAGSITHLGRIMQLKSAGWTQIHARAREREREEVAGGVKDREKPLDLYSFQPASRHQSETNLWVSQDNKQRGKNRGYSNQLTGLPPFKSVFVISAPAANSARNASTSPHTKKCSPNQITQQARV